MKKFLEFITEAIENKKQIQSNQKQVEINPPVEQPSQQIEQEPPKPVSSTTTLAFGRFNPPHIGHQKLMDKAAQIAGESGDYKIYPSRTHDPKKNPLHPTDKVNFMRKIYKQHANAVQDDENVKTVIHALQKAHEQGYKDVNIVVGQDRVQEFESLARKYNGPEGLYNFNSINIHSAGERDPNAASVEGMSASKMRKAAADNDYQTFKSGLPADLEDDAAQELYQTLRRHMKISEDYELWEIAPRLDKMNLQENYKTRNLFPVGSIVESLGTGLIGKVIRTGVNYVIALTDDKIPFRGWTWDINRK
jgi:hypothetical protein